MISPLKIGQPRFLTADEVLAWHRASTDVYGGVEGIVDMGRLEASLAMAAHGVAGALSHSFPFEMAAAYGFHLAMNHPFRDGNKRTALTAMVAFLRMNGWDVVVEDPGTADQILELIEQRQSKQWLAHWLEDNSRARPSFELRDFFSAITYEADLDALQALAGSARACELDAAISDAARTIPALESLVEELSMHLQSGNADQFMQVGVQVVVYLRLYRLAEDMGYEW